MNAKNIVIILVICALIISNIVFAVKLFCNGSGKCGAKNETTAVSTATPVDTTAQKIELIAPIESGATLLQALQTRASVRDYTADGLTLEQLSGVFLCLCRGSSRRDFALAAWLRTRSNRRDSVPAKGLRT